MHTGLWVIIALFALFILIWSKLEPKDTYPGEVEYENYENDWNWPR